MNKEKLTIVSKIDNIQKTDQAPVGSRDANIRQRANIKRVQNVLLVWLDNNADEEKNEDCCNTIAQLRHVVNNINKFTDSNQCIEFLETNNKEKICMIISGSLGQHIVPLIHNKSHVDSIFIFCSNKKYHEQWAREWPKIKGVFTKISFICDALKEAAQQCEHNSTSISVMPTCDDTLNKKLNQLDPIFMYTQILKEILLTIKFEKHHIHEYVNYCRDAFAENEQEIKNIKTFKRTYHDKTPIWWYTYNCFLYPMLNRGLRTIDGDIMIKMGFFISDLHRHIEQLHKEQFSHHNNSTAFTVYRGQGLSKTDFDQLKNTKGGLLSFNNFLSTSKDRKISLSFAHKGLSNPDLMGILFVMTIDPSKATTPFAYINGISFFPAEDEVLFSMNTVFRIHDIQPMNDNPHLFQVNLTLTTDNDKDLRRLTDCIREETEESTGWFRLGKLLFKLGQLQKAQEIYEILLYQTNDEREKANIYHQLAMIKDDQIEYHEAITLYKKSLEIYKRIRPPYHPDLAKSYNNIGMVYYNMGEYLKALSFYEKTMEIDKKTLPSNHPSLAGSYNNIGMVYSGMGDYTKALSYYEKTLEIAKKTLPSTHPDLAGFYHNIGTVYYDMDEYSKALLYYEKSLETDKKARPSNHPQLAAAYNQIGNVYDSMGEYSKAHSYYARAVDIAKHLLSSNHPDVRLYKKNLNSVKKKL